MTRNLILILMAGVLILSCSKNGEQKNSMTLTAEDGVTLSAELHRPKSSPPWPGVILVHQGGSDRSEWDFIIPDLLEEGYCLLALDLREHGESTKTGNIRDLFTNPKRAPLDLKAAYVALRSTNEVDQDRIAIFGSSIGGNLALVASETFSLPAVISLSPKTGAVRALAGKEKIVPQNALIIASDGDQDGKRKEWARELHSLTRGDRKVLIVEGSSAHGVSMFQEKPDLKKECLEWFEKRLR
jgi:dienelactone hydrolase